MLWTRVGSSNVANTRWSIITCCRIGSAGRVIFSGLWRLSWSLLSTSSTCRRYHIDLSAERLTLLRLSGLPRVIVTRFLLGVGRTLASECEMLLSLALCSSGMLGTMVIASTRSLNVWLRGLWLVLLLIWGIVVATRGIDGLIILPRDSHDIIIRWVAFRFFNQLDYLLGVMKLRVISYRLSDNELFLFDCVDRISLIDRGGATASSSTIIVLEVVDQLNFVGAEDFVRLPLLLLTFAWMRLGPYILCSSWLLFLLVLLLLLLLTSRAFSLLLAFIVTRLWFDYYGGIATILLLAIA